MEGLPVLWMMDAKFKASQLAQSKKKKKRNEVSCLEKSLEWLE